MLTAFSPDYATARRRFREAADRLGWSLEAHSIGSTGPEGEELTIDIGYSAAEPPDKILVISSGVHGVEGFFGSAVQIALLELWASTSPPPIRCVFLHALNPFGFAWLRRCDENNVDPNRNFLLPGESYQGAPLQYASLDKLLNPRCPPSRWEPFRLKAFWKIARTGVSPLRHAIATGQYEYPQGLFYGGAGPTAMQNLLETNLDRWLASSQQVVHLDFHTGLGRQAACKFLIDYQLSDRQRAWLVEWFGADAFENCNSEGVAYNARGGLGRWCVSRNLAPDYLFACAEFGTYGQISMLSGLRSENQSHHWGNPSSASTARTKQKFKELFCPAAESWRLSVINTSVDLVARAVCGLTGNIS
ncbi:M14 family metallopeptidase [Stieleria mannarensis]|uniref:M14 family metallopeptidase n=1 Tax=Stieleria mannarensis TaxID=2755585 RepID=UPI001C7293E6|nr:M14 family metallopeptidase [Rhodopirellula sp. JC639]